MNSPLQQAQHLKEYYKEYRKKNKLMIAKNTKRYRLKNKAKLKEMNRIWRLKQLDRLNKKSIDYNRNKLFGGNWLKVMKRDNWQCVKCGINNEEHLRVYGRNLTIDHKDGNGCNVKNPNNELSNLQTLCLKCHGKKDINKRKIHHNQYIKKSGVKVGQVHRKIVGKLICYCRRKMIFIDGMWICRARIKIMPNKEILK